MAWFKKKESPANDCDCGGKCNLPVCATETPAACDCGGKCAPVAVDSTVFPASDATVKVLGSGCAKCNQLEAAAKQALAQLGRDITVAHVTDFAQIANYGVMSTPALVIKGKVVSHGKVLKPQKVVELLQKANAT